MMPFIFLSIFLTVLFLFVFLFVVSFLFVSYEISPCANQRGQPELHPVTAVSIGLISFFFSSILFFLLFLLLLLY